MGITGAEVEIDAHDLRWSFRELQATGERAALSIGVLRLLGKNVTLLLERVFTRVRRS